MHRMTRFALAAIAIAALMSAPGLQAQDRSVQSDQDTLIALEREWNAAVYRKDVGFIGGILAEDFAATYDDGSHGDKARELALVEAFNQHVDSAVQDEFKVRVDRDTAVVWFKLTLIGPKQGVPTTVVLRYVDVFAMRDGRWQCVSSQSTRVNPR